MPEGCCTSPFSQENHHHVVPEYRSAACQITVSLRNDAGDVLLARQVSTQPEKIRAFIQHLTEKPLTQGEGFLAVLEVCGFNDRLIRMLEEYHYYKVILIQPEDRQRNKTDRQAAAALSELLWGKQERFLAGKPVRGLRQVALPSLRDQENRRLTTLRKEASQGRTRIVNKIKHLLRRHSLQWDLPTKTFPTQRGVEWLQQVPSSPVDRLEMEDLLVDLKTRNSGWGNWNESSSNAPVSNRKRRCCGLNDKR